MSETAAVGDPIPDIPLETSDGKTFSIGDFAGKRVVLFFYPKDNTPGCTTEATDFSALKPDFDKAGVALLGISKDSPQKHRNFIAKHALKVPLATDREDDGLSDRLGVWAEKKMYGKAFMGMVRTTFLVGLDGRIERVWNKVKVKGHAAEVLEAARSK